MKSFFLLFAPLLHIAFAQFICTADVKCCKHNKTKCVGRDQTTVDCDWLPCRPVAERPAWARPEGNKTRISDKFQELLDAGGAPPFRNVFIDDTEYRNLTKTERKDAKKYLYRKYRGFPIKVQKSDETVLDYDKGGIKLFKKFKNPDRDFFLIDDPEFENDGVEISPGEAFTFEDAAEFKRQGKNYSCTTERKTAAEGHHKTTFTNKDTDESCTVDGKTATGCKVGTTRFDVLFSGSCGTECTDVQCLSQTDDNIVSIVDVAGVEKYTFNGEAYDEGVKIGLNLGTYVLADIPEGHPLLIDIHSNFTEDVSCDGTIVSHSGHDHCNGTLTFTITDDFDFASYECSTHINGAMGGTDRLFFDDTCSTAADAAAAAAAAADDDDDMSTGTILLYVFAAVVVAAALSYVLYKKVIDPIDHGAVHSSNV